jgi:hypothetical protein
VAVVGVVAGAAVLGGSSSGVPTSSQAEIASPEAESSTARSSAVAFESATGRLRLFEPGEGLVTSQELLVRGSTDEGVDHLTVTLESIGRKALSMSTIEAASPFTLTMAIPVGRDGTRLRVRVIAYDATGIPVDVIGREVTIGPYVPRSIGGDGFIGGIVFGSSWDDRRGDP